MRERRKWAKSHDLDLLKEVFGKYDRTRRTTMIYKLLWAKKEYRHLLINRAIRDLRVRDQEALRLRFGLRRPNKLDEPKKHTYPEMAEMMGVSPVRCRQITMNALRRLKTQLKGHLFDDLYIRLTGEEL